MKVLIIVASLLLACTVRAGDISGTIRFEPSITHAATNTANAITETISAWYRWSGSGAIGAVGTAGGIEKLWSHRVTLAAGATNTYDLAGGVTNAFGETLTFAKVKLFAVTCTNSMTNMAQSVLVQPAPANGWGSWMSATTAAVRVFSGGFFAIGAPVTNAYSVTDSTGDLLDIKNESTNAVRVDLLIGGE